MQRLAPRYRVVDEADIKAAIPYLGGSSLSRCVQAMIDRLDELNDDCDLEPEEDAGADDFGEAEPI